MGASMTRAGDPFAGLDELLIDGNNLLHRVAGSVEPRARHELLATLRARLPPRLYAVLVLDGPPDRGAPPTQRISPTLEVRHAGRTDADSAIVALLESRPYPARARIAVVSDDRALRDRVRRAGGATRRLAWLNEAWAPRRPPAGRTPPTAHPGANRPGKAAPEEEGEEAAQREPWRPGRGATTKHGNPRRRGRAGRPSRLDGRTL